MTSFEYKVDSSQNLQRLDLFLVQKTGRSRSFLQHLIHQGGVSLIKNSILQVMTSPKHEVTSNESYILSLKNDLPSFEGKAGDLHIIYEDDDLMVINKPAGQTVHPGAGTEHEITLAHILAHHRPGLSSIRGEERAGLVHRLDKDTSGLMVIAKHNEAHVALAHQFLEKSLQRTYTAFVWGMPSPSKGTIKSFMGTDPKNHKRQCVLDEGKLAITHYQTERVWPLGQKSMGYSHIICQLETGRTHQIRVHLAHKGHPILGDAVYGHLLSKKLSEQKWHLKRQALHAHELSFIHPKTKIKVSFSCPLPDDLCIFLI